MIELAMVRRMIVRGLLLTPPVVIAMYVWGQGRYAASAAVGIGMTLLNLWIAGRIIGGVADRRPELLMPVAMATFVLGLMVLTGIALGLKATDAVYFPVTGFTLIGIHFVVVLWEAAGPIGEIDTKTGTPMDARS